VRLHDVELGENKEFYRKTFTDISQNSTALSLATVQRHVKKNLNSMYDMLKYEFQN